MASRESRGVARGSSHRRDQSQEKPPNFSGESSDELRILLLGKTRAGKSETGNTILGREVFRTGWSALSEVFAALLYPQSVTRECQRESAEINGRHVTVIDTPGLFNLYLTKEEIQRKISNCIPMTQPGPHVFIIVLTIGQQFTEVEAASVKIIREMLGEKCLMYTMLLFTRGDDLKDRTIKQILEDEPRLMELAEACGNRFHVFNNRESGDRTQVCDLLEKIDNMVKTNGGGFYSNEMLYRLMNKEQLEQQMKIMMDRVRERGEVINKLEEEKDRMKMKMEKLKREREELMKKHEEEKERMKMMMEEERHEQHKLIRRHQTAEPGHTHTHTHSAEGEADDLEQLRIVLIGRTGSGKSATGNSILGRDEFVSQLSMSSVTTDCQKGVSEADGRSVAVVDTLGLFDMTLPNDQVIENLMKCVSMSAPGPHVFVIVLSLGRFHRHEMDTVDLIKRIFGPKTAQFSIVLFTGGDGLGDESVEDYVNRSESAELKKLIRDCGDRFLAFNNREKRDRTQVIRLLKMIEELKHTSEGRYFTNSMFEEAEMSIKKRTKEIMNENEREIKTQHEALNTKHEMEMKNMMKRLEEEKRRADEERMKTQNQLREKEEKLRKEFEEKERREQMKQETENQKRLEEEKQKKAEHHKKIEELKREIENQRLQYEKQQKEREEDRKREEKYRRDQETMGNEHERIIAELQMRYEEEIKRRDLEKQRRNEEEEEERQRWRGRIKEAENDRKEIQEEMKQQQREWEEEKKQQMREREEEERRKKEKHEEQLREKQEELEKMRERFEREREEERRKIEEERQKQRREREDKEREYDEKIHEMKRLEQEREEEWEKRKREGDERREEERKRWTKMIEDVKREQEEEIKRREEEEKERKEREEKERDEMKQKHEEEIRVLKKSHEEEARRQAERTDFRERKELEHVQQMLEERQKQHELLEELHEQKKEEIKEQRQENGRLNNRSCCAIL